MSALWKRLFNYQFTGTTKIPKNSTLTADSGSTVNIAGTFQVGGTAVTSTAAELNYLDVTAGTGAVSKALVLDASGNVTMPDNGAIGLSRAAVAAAGSGASDATVLADQVNAVTGSDGAKGVALPAAATTAGPIYVINTVLTSGANLLVYPVNGGNDNINGGAEDAAFTMGPGEAAWFIPTSATQWYVSDKAGTLTTTTEENILDGVTASAAEINYLDITTLGTGAASKAVVLDAGDDYTWPATGVLTYGVLKDGPGNTTITATGAEVNRSCDASARVVATTSTTLALTVTEHAERLVLINTNSTVANTFTLPVATGSGCKFTLINGIAQTQGSIVVAANGTDVFAGGVIIADTTAETAAGFLTSATSDKYTFNLTTMGGLGADKVEAWDVAANTWQVQISAFGSGTLATGFSAT